MENAEIARALAEVADLLDIQGANPFRIRAYRNAVRTIEGLGRPACRLVEEGFDLRELPGIGQDIAGYITELCQTGHLQLLDQLRREVPAGLTELMQLEGVGPKKAKRFYEELGVRSIEELERAIDQGKVAALPGFGERTAQKIKRAIQDHRRRTGRFKLSDADQFVEPLLAYMRTAPGIERMEVAGSYRRRAETVGDIDLLVVCSRAEPVMDHFAAYPGAARVAEKGTTRGAIILKAGLRVDLRIVPHESYGAALHYFTGSKAHNIAVRKLGVEKGLRINEYGVFRLGRRGGPEQRERAAHRIGGAHEEDVFRAVGMDWVPPELREDRGEVQAALEHRLPKLVTLDDIRGDLQMHSTWSDGTNTIEEMARACRERGYQYMAITDHSRAVTVAGGLTPQELERQWEEIDQVRKKVDGILILKGMEVDILRDGSLDLPDEYLYRLDLVVASVHSHFGLDRVRMTDRIIKAISHPAVHILGHPTGRILGRREPYDVDVDAVLQAAAELGVAVELNAQPDRLDLADVHLMRARELGVKVAIDTDAHSRETLAFMRYGVDQARRGWLEPKDIVNCMTPAALQRWLRRRRPKT